MITFSSHLNYYIFSEPTDMRKGYNGLSGIVRNEIKGDPSDGSVYVFFNKSGRLMKMLVWDKDGYVMYSKRLEQGTFERITKTDDQTTYPIKYEHLVMLLSGISLLGIKQRCRYKGLGL